MRPGTRGLRRPPTEWVALLDSDNVWLPHHLATVWRHRDGRDLVSASALRYEFSTHSDRFHGPVGRSVVTLDSPAKLAFPGNFICASGTIVRKPAVEAAGGFQSRRRLVEDLDLWVRLFEHGTGVAIPLVTVNYRVHDQQKSTRSLRDSQQAHIAACTSRAAVGPVDIERWKGGATWDNFRISVRSRNWRRAAGQARSVTCRPDRALGLFGTWIWRFLVRRRGFEVDRDGWPSIAVLPNSPAAEVLPELATGRRLKVTRYSSVIRAVASLLRRPAGVLFVGSRAQRTMARLLAAHACVDGEEARALFPPLEPTSVRGEYCERTPSLDLLTQ